MQEKKNFRKTFELKIRRFIREERLLSKNDRCVVAVSGGADSLCLLLLLSKWAKSEGWDLKVAYFHHHLRDSADDEKAFVKSWAERLGLDFVFGESDCKEMQQTEKLSLEEVARRERYRFLKEQAALFASAKIAVGHHLDDQVETFFVNLIKGGGLSGLSGMRPQNGALIRPLLSVTKLEILDYLELQNIRYCIDETNDFHHIVRNRVRHKLIPFLKKEFQWNLCKSLPRMMKVFSAEDRFLKAIEKEWGGDHIHWERGGASVRVRDFLSLDEALQRRMIKVVLDRFSSQRNYSSQHIEENRKLFFNAGSHKKITLPEGIVASRVKEGVQWGKSG